MLFFSFLKTTNFCEEDLIDYWLVFQIWVIDSSEEQKKDPGASYQSSLSYHSSAVNALRFSPSGKGANYYHLSRKNMTF